MKITYNLQVLPQRKNSRKDSEETTALKAFLADSEKKNMVFEYDTPQEAKKRYEQYAELPQSPTSSRTSTICGEARP